MRFQLVDAAGRLREPALEIRSARLRGFQLGPALCAFLGKAGAGRKQLGASCGQRIAFGAGDAQPVSGFRIRLLGGCGSFLCGGCFFFGA